MEVKSIKEFEKSTRDTNFRGGLVVCGEEKNLVEQSVDILYKTIRDFPELNISKLDGDSITLDAIVNACETLPFMGDKKLVHVKRAVFLSKEYSLGADFNKALNNYIKDIPQNVILLFSLDGLADAGNTTVKTIKATGLFAEYKKIKGEELQRWVLENFEKNNKAIGKGECTYLIAEVGNSMELLEREIEKICSFALDEEVITKSHIDSIVHKSIESNIFKMVDSISRKDANTAIGILNLLLFQKEDHLKILGMIIRQIRLMFIIKAGLNGKKSNMQINSELKLNNYVFENLVKQARNYTEEGLKKLLNICLDTDYKLKNGGYSHDFYGLALEMLIVELCK